MRSIQEDLRKSTQIGGRLPDSFRHPFLGDPQRYVEDLIDPVCNRYGGARSLAGGHFLISYPQFRQQAADGSIPSLEHPLRYVPLAGPDDPRGRPRQVGEGLVDGLPGHGSSETECAAAVATLKGATEKRQLVYALVDARGEHRSTDIEGQDECCYSFPKRWCDLKHHCYGVDSGKKRLTPCEVVATVNTPTPAPSRDYTSCRSCEDYVAVCIHCRRGEGCGCRCEKRAGEEVN